LSNTPSTRLQIHNLKICMHVQNYVHILHLPIQLPTQSCARVKRNQSDGRIRSVTPLRYDKPGVLHFVGRYQMQYALVPRRVRIKKSRTLLSLCIRLQDLLGSVPRVKKKTKKDMRHAGYESKLKSGRSPCAIPREELSRADAHKAKGCLAHTNTHPPRTPPQAYFQGPMGVLGGWALSYGGGTPVRATSISRCTRTP
jgi:hypothetical protein